MHIFIPSLPQLSYPSSRSWFSESCDEAAALKQLAFSSWKENPTKGNLRSFNKAGHATKIISSVQAFQRILKGMLKKKYIYIYILYICIAAYQVNNDVIKFSARQFSPRRSSKMFVLIRYSI